TLRQPSALPLPLHLVRDQLSGQPLLLDIMRQRWASAFLLTVRQPMLDRGIAIIAENFEVGIEFGVELMIEIARAAFLNAVFQEMEKRLGTAGKSCTAEIGVTRQINAPIEAGRYQRHIA